MRRLQKWIWLLCAAVMLAQNLPAAAAVEPADYLAAAAEALGAYYRITPVYGQDTNVCRMLEEDLAAAGYGAIEAAVQTVEIRQDGGNIAENGDITYFYADPDSFRGYWGAAAYVTFTLTYETASMAFRPAYTVNIPWDEDQVRAYIEKNAGDDLTFEAIRGENEDTGSVRENLVLPQYCNENRNVRIRWESSDPAAIAIQSPEGSVDEVLYGNYTGLVQPGENPKTVTLTATLTFNRADIALTKTFTLTVPPLGGSTEEEEMQTILAGYTLDRIRDLSTGESIGDGSRVTGDLGLPTPAEIGIYDRRYDVLLSVENPADIAYINVPNLKNAGRVYIFRPLPEEGDKRVSFTVTLQSRQNGNLTASKTFSVTISALDQRELEQAAADMEAVKNQFFDFIRGNNTDPANITEDLNSFYGIYKENGVFTAKSYSERGTSGILAAVINPEQPVPDDQRYFATSHPQIIAEESLRVTRPQQDTAVTISACLSDERYSPYLENDGYPLQYPYDYSAKYGGNQQLRSLYRQPVQATVTVKAAPAAGDIVVTVNCQGAVPMVQGTRMAQVTVRTEDLDDNGQLTVHEVLTALHAQYCPAGYETGSRGEITRLWGVDEGEFILYRNHALVTTPAQTILDGDYLEVYAVSAEESGGRYLRFGQDQIQTEVDVPFSIVLIDGKGQAVPGIQIGYLDEQGEFMPVPGAVTDAAGQTAIRWETTGTVYLSVQAEDSLAPVCAVQVVDQILTAETITVSPETVTLVPGEQAFLQVEIYPQEAGGQILYWKSSDPNVAAVNPKGIVSAVGAGSAVVTVTNGRGREAGCLVTVERKNEGGGGGGSETFSAVFTLKAGDAVWIPRMTVNGLERGDTVFDVFQQALKKKGFTYTAQGGYVSAVTNAQGITLASFDYGANSGWMYMVDGVISPVYMEAHRLTGGEEIVFFYTGDYTEEEQWNGGGLPSGGKQNGTARPQAPDVEESENTDVREISKLPFTDVPEDAWYYPAVCAVYENGLFSGITETEFAPVRHMSRAMLTAVLYRMAGIPEAAGKAVFSDVKQTDWYYSAVLWAAEHGIVSGVSETEFAPDMPVTREQAAAMLYRFAQARGIGTAETADLQGFSDAGLVSAWAAPAISWTVAAGIMQGRDDGRLDPLGWITRAEAAQVLTKLIDRTV